MAFPTRFSPAFLVVQSHRNRAFPFPPNLQNRSENQLVAKFSFFENVKAFACSGHSPRNFEQRLVSFLPYINGVSNLSGSKTLNKKYPVPDAP